MACRKHMRRQIITGLWEARIGLMRGQTTAQVCEPMGVTEPVCGVGWAGEGRAGVFPCPVLSLAGPRLPDGATGSSACVATSFRKQGVALRVRTHARAFHLDALNWGGVL